MPRIVFGVLADINVCSSEAGFLPKRSAAIEYLLPSRFSEFIDEIREGLHLSGGPCREALEIGAIIFQIEVRLR